MSPLVTYDCPRHPKPRKNIFFKESNHNLVIIGSSGDSLNTSKHNHLPKGYIGSQRRWKQTHKISPPTIKNLNDKNGRHRHHIFPGHTSQLLAPIASLAELKRNP